MTNQEFAALAERCLLAMTTGDGGYVPPENTHMFVSSAIRMADEFVKGLAQRRKLLLTSSELTAEEIDAVTSGNKIDAIKMVRERLGLMLKDAKAFVDQATKDDDDVS